MNIPSPGNYLHLLAGQWTGQETIAASKWGPGGTATATISARLDFDGRTLIQDYRAERDGKIWLTAHAVFVFNEATNKYSLFWFDSLGFAPTQPAIGEQDGHTLKFIRVSPRGQTRHIYSFKEPGTYHLKLESSFDDGVTWIHVMDGRYSK